MQSETFPGKVSQEVPGIRDWCLTAQHIPGFIRKSFDLAKGLLVHLEGGWAFVELFGEVAMVSVNKVYKLFHKRDILKQLTSKTLACAVASRAAKLILQFRVGMRERGGYEAVVHATKETLAREEQAQDKK